MTWVMVGLPLLLLVLGFPIFLVLLTTSAVVLVFFSEDPATVIHLVMFGSIDKFALLAVPFFIFAGEMMSKGGVSIRLVNWVTSIVGGIRGSLPLTAVGTATIFGAISGSTAATVAAVGSLTYEPLLRKGYDEKFTAGELKVGIVSPPDIAINFRKAQEIGLRIPFSFFESASFVYDYEGLRVRNKGKSVPRIMWPPPSN